MNHQVKKKKQLIICQNCFLKTEFFLLLIPICHIPIVM